MQQAVNVKKIKLTMNKNEDIVEKLKKSEKEIQNGEGINSEDVFKELRAKYGY